MIAFPVLLDEGTMSEAAAAKKPVAKKSDKGAYYEVAKELGLIGCIDGPPDLATNYRKYLQKAVRAKYRAR